MALYYERGTPVWPGQLRESAGGGGEACRGARTSLTRACTPLGPYRGPMPRVLGQSLGDGRLLMGEVPLYKENCRQLCVCCASTVRCELLPSLFSAHCCTWVGCQVQCVRPVVLCRGTSPIENAPAGPYSGAIYGLMVILWGGLSLMCEVPLYMYLRLSFQDRRGSDLSPQRHGPHFLRENLCTGVLHS